MPKFRQRRNVVLTMVVIAALLGGSSACGAGLAPAAAAANFNAGWAQEAARLLSQFRPFVKVRALTPSTRADIQRLGHSVDDVITRAPRPELRTPEIDAQLVALRAARDFQAVIAGADNRRLSLVQAADEVAGASTGDQQLMAQLRKDGTDILQDAACDGAFSLMTPGEKDDTKQSGWTDYVQDVGVTPVADAVNNYGQARIAGIFGPGAVRAVKWFQYGTGIEEKYGELSSGFSGPPVSLDPAANQLVTRAFVHYARMCLRPPG